jgi:hypothetical protein
MDLLSLHQLFPKSSTLHIEGSTQNIKHLETLNFEELETLSFDGTAVDLVLFTKFLVQLKENKLRKIIFPDFIVQEEKEILEFYKNLFNKTNLEEFHRIFPFNSSTKEESNLFSSWIDTNLNLKKLSLGGMSKFF